MSFVPTGLRPQMQALMRRLDAVWERKSDGSLSSSDWYVRFYEGAVVQLLDARPAKLTRSEFEGCAWRAIHQALKNSSGDIEELEACLEAEIRECRRKRSTPYTIITRCHFSLPQRDDLELIACGTKLTFSRNPPDRVDVSEFFVNGYGSARPDEPSGGAYCRIEVRARTPDAALELASDRIAEAFGQLNFWINLGRIRYTVGGPEIRADLFPGKELFVLHADGRINTDLVRFYLSTPSSVKSVSDGELAKLLSIDEFNLLLDSRPPKEKSHYSNFFRLYFDGMTERDVDMQVVRLWKAAEFATFSQGGRADDIARRLAVTWDDRELVHAVCFSLGHRRNAIVHHEDIGLSVDVVPELFRHMLEFSAWYPIANRHSLKTWRTVLRLETSGLDFAEAARAIRIGKQLRRPRP